jgi:hypothetical protein
MTDARWNRADLIWRLCRALDIAGKAVERLASEGYQDPAEPSNSVAAEKLISETAVLLVAASAVPEAQPVAAHADRLAQMLIPHARSQRMRLGLCLRPALAWDYGLAHLCLQRLGYRDAEFDRLFRHSLRSQAQRGRERVPHRVLEIEWLGRMQRKTAAPALRHRCALQQSVLSHAMDLFGGTRDDVYAFTHAVMYTADFNIRPVSFPRPRQVLLGEAEAALARAVDAEDYDICGELLMTWPLTGTTWNAASAFGFKVLADVEDQVGFLPTAGTRLDKLNALEGAARVEYLTATVYHTAYVMGLLCAVALAPCREPPRHLPFQHGAPRPAAAILPFLEDGGRRRHWQETFDRLPPMDRDALCGFLLIIALHRRVATYDFAAVAELLALAVSLDLADTPAASQAAELLGRLSVAASPGKRRDAATRPDTGGPRPWPPVPGRINGPEEPQSPKPQARRRPQRIRPRPRRALFGSALSPAAP